MEMNVKNILVMGAIAFGAVWLGNRLLNKLGATDLQA